MEDIEEVFSNLLRRLPLNDNQFERNTFKIKKNLGGGWNGYILRRGEVRAV